jgi:hypothetical protein
MGLWHIQRQGRSLLGHTFPPSLIGANHHLPMWQNRRATLFVETPKQEVKEVFEIYTKAAVRSLGNTAPQAL